MQVTERDAQAVGSSRNQLGEENSEVIRETVAVYCQEQASGATFCGLALSLFATVGLLVVFVAPVRIRRAVRVLYRSE